MDYGISWSDSAGLSLAEAGIMNSPEVAESAIYRYVIFFDWATYSSLWRLPLYVTKNSVIHYHHIWQRWHESIYLCGSFIGLDIFIYLFWFWPSEWTVCSYTHRYIQLLEADKRVDALEVVNERIRKRFKNPKLVGAQSGQVCKHACFAWCRALCTALCSITSVSQETLLTTAWSLEQGLEERKDQELLFVNLQVMLLSRFSWYFLAASLLVCLLLLSSIKDLIYFSRLVRLCSPRIWSYTLYNLSIN